MSRKLYGVGTGPGASDLLTVRATEVIKQADVVFAPDNRGKNMALDTAAPYLNHQKIVKMSFPMGSTEEKTYEDAMKVVYEELKPGMIGVFLNIGDTTIYSTFMNMVKLNKPEDLEIELVPGIPSFVAAANVIKENLVMKGERFLLCDEPSEAPLEHVDAIAILKTFQHVEDTLELLDQHDFSYFYVYRATLPDQFVLTEREDIIKEKNYMSLLLARKEKL